MAFGLAGGPFEAETKEDMPEKEKKALEKGWEKKMKRDLKEITRIYKKLMRKTRSTEEKLAETVIVLSAVAVLAASVVLLIKALG